MTDPIRDLLEGYAQAPAHDVSAVAETVVARGRRKVRRRRAVTAGSLVAVVLLVGIAAAGAIGTGGSSKIRTGGGPATSSTTAPRSEPRRSIGLTDAQQEELFTEHMKSLEACMRAQGIKFSVEIQDPRGVGRFHYGDRGMPNPDEERAMAVCSGRATAQEEAERDRLLREAGNPVVTLELAACPALEEVVVNGDLPDRFNTDAVEAKAGGIPLNTCFGTITTGGSGEGEITVSEGIAGDSAAATRDEGVYLVGSARDGFIAVYDGDQLPSHYIEARGVTAQEFDMLILSLQQK